MNDLLPSPWRISSTANIHNLYGDLYAKMGDVAKAREHYAEAIRLYPTSNQPYGRHLLPRQVSKVRSKLELLEMNSLPTARLRDGTFTGKPLDLDGDFEQWPRGQQTEWLGEMARLEGRFADMPLAIAREFRFEVRPFSWGEFRNGALKPGPRTWIEIVQAAGEEVDQR